MPGEADKERSGAVTQPETTRVRTSGWLLPHGAFDQEDQLFIRQMDADKKEAEFMLAQAEKDMFLQAKTAQLRTQTAHPEFRLAQKQLARADDRRPSTLKVIRRNPPSGSTSGGNATDELSGLQNVNKRARIAGTAAEAARTNVEADGTAHKTGTRTNDCGPSDLKPSSGPVPTSSLSALGDYGSDSD